ncbi:xanthotoxin 5-hydroxylase CYP82C4-like [Lycium ferocissimum]|uniref:xanthotoxin 5-hydroxylase CYP82C4-like n=1 Tax=Lycium ferocissimum TaxID=112874 RepID=UPI002816332C|nr:xanthotoxin 5-hydroxylase CYP82C4-like [Lycium ferocissimum]
MAITGKYAKRLFESIVKHRQGIRANCPTLNDKALASRPTTVTAKHMGYGYAVFRFAPFWREMRKIAMFELLSNRRLDTLKHVQVSEVDIGIHELYKLWSDNNSGRPMLVELKRWFEGLTLNIIVRMVAGKCYFGAGATCDNDDEARRCQKAINQIFHLIGIFAPADAFPILGWYDINGHEKAMKKTAKELDSILAGSLKEHNEKTRCTYSWRQRASDTTAGTLAWAISLLLNNPKLLMKTQEEIDLHVGKNRQVDESDTQNLVYIQAIIKETLRLYPASPLLGPREAMDNCEVGGYKITPGTRFIVNVWKIQRDPRVLEDPDSFKPDRFLMSSHSNVDVKGQDFELIPFGSGRRSCPGASLALQVLHLMLARLLQAFEFSKPLDDQPIDLTESPSLTIPKATPLDVLITPRISANLYSC